MDSLPGRWDFSCSDCVQLLDSDLMNLPGKPDAEIVETGEDLNDMYVAQAARVLDDLRTGGAPLTGIDQALAVLRLQMRWRQIGPYSESGA